MNDAGMPSISTRLPADVANGRPKSISGPAAVLRTADRTRGARWPASGGRTAPALATTAPRSSRTAA